MRAEFPLSALEGPIFKTYDTFNRPFEGQCMALQALSEYATPIYWQLLLNPVSFFFRPIPCQQNQSISLSLQVPSLPASSLSFMHKRCDEPRIVVCRLDHFACSIEMDTVCTS